MESNETFDRILHQLELMSELLAFQSFGKMKMTEGAPILKRLGFSNSEIASVYNSTAHVVSVRLAEAKKKK
jgi:hypothetical protein